MHGTPSASHSTSYLPLSLEGDLKPTYTSGESSTHRVGVGWLRRALPAVSLLQLHVRLGLHARAHPAHATRRSRQLSTQQGGLSLNI